MTKEPIMIDDVDVSGCEYAEPSYTTPKCAINDWIHCDGHDCHYKQLKRLENEYEGFAVKYTDMEIALKNKEEEYDELNKYRPIIDRLLQEFEKYEYIKSISTISYAKQVFEQLDQLKEKNKWYDHYKESALRNKELYNDLSTKYDQLKAECEKWKNNYHKSTAKMTIKEIDQSTYIAQLEKTLNRIRTERDNYKQALQEIKEIITNSFDSCYVCNSKDSCEKCLQGEILQKCEVIKDE